MWDWLNTPPTQRPGESAADAERRMRSFNRVWKGFFALQYVVPAVLLAVVVLVLLLRALF